jgi:hypothetical protein
MEINVDELLVVPPPSDGRIFPYDAFLSHNRDDGSANLAKLLNAAHVAVWHDGDADLRDSRVRQAVAGALSDSRYIVVCVDSTFRDSAWVRAEYEPGLRFEAEHRVPRVLVAAMDYAPAIPASLAACPIYNIPVGELARLAECLRTGNLPPLQPLAPLQRESAIDGTELLSAVAEATRMAPVASPDGRSDEDLVAFIIRAATELIQEDEDSRKFLFPLADIGEHPDIQALSTHHVCKRILRALALHTCRSEYTDERADALRILLSLTLGGANSAATDVINFLRHEDREDVVELAEDWLRTFAKLDEKIVDELKLPGLRSPNAFKPTAFGHFTYTPPRRVRELLKRNVLMPAVTSSEALKLAKEQLEFLLEHPAHRGATKRLGILAPLLEIGEFEIFLRDTCRDLLHYSPGEHVLDEGVAANRITTEGVLDLFERLIAHSQDHGGRPLMDLAEGIPDWVLHPLIMLRQVDGLEDRCSRCYEAACAILAGSQIRDATSQAQSYLQLLASVIRGESYEDAHRQCRLATVQRHSAKFNV